LHAVALALLRDSALAEDALQDAFVQAWHRAGEFHSDRGTVLTWLTTIVRYRAIDILRKRAKGGAPGNLQPVSVDPLSLDFLQQGSGDSDDDGHRGPLANAIEREESVMLHDCLDRLSNSQQRSVALAFFRGFTHQELANCLAEPLGTIKSRLRRSLARLKDCLQTAGEEYEIQSGAN
jgi:RNA polymerase sigma-70 factor (ECF subfamily)